LITGTVGPSTVGTLITTATVTNPAGSTDSTPANNTAGDTDSVAPAPADLSIVVIDSSGTAFTNNGVTTGGTVNENGPVTYSIVVTNNGPYDVPGANVIDTLPNTVLGAHYTTHITGTGSDTNATGSGNLNDQVTLSSGSSITYTITGTVSGSATNFIVDNATVSTPTGYSDPTSSNNSSMDTVSLPTGLTVNVTGPATSIPGQSVTFMITVTNTGPNSIMNANISNLAPSGIIQSSLTYVGSDNG